MRRFVLLGLFGLSALVMTGCPAKPKNGECKSSDDCASQTGYGKVCVDGRCQECGVDADCSTGFVCRSNKCLPKPQCGNDSDCPAGQTCQNDRCVARAAGSCESDRDCPDGRCEAGRCVVQAAQVAVPPECATASAFTIRFRFDESTITADAEQSLRRLADCLSRAPAKRVIVQGNADERGTAEYNIALGGRRADAARKYLRDLGTATTLDTVSYGEERPVCTQSKEECWARNRRDDFDVER